MKQKHTMSQDELRTYVASEVESIRSEIDRLRYDAEHMKEGSGLHAEIDSALVTGEPGIVAARRLPELQKAYRGH